MNHVTLHMQTYGSKGNSHLFPTNIDGQTSPNFLLFTKYMFIVITDIGGKIQSQCHNRAAGVRNV